jgi:S-adenosylmethionine:tRNA ribosyltransferase-isomerase
VKLEELDFDYPENLVATERREPTRVMLVQGGEPLELADLSEIFECFQPGDCLVVNDTRVLRRRVFSESGLEILFLKPTSLSRFDWQVLCPSSRWKNDKIEHLPGGVALTLIERGRTQVVRADRELSDSYFDEHGELPLPPYIQKARGERRNRTDDRAEYQTAWAKNAGSLAAPTASLHFSERDLSQLKEKGVHVETITLHVGLGTFLPVTVPTLDEHVMHAESVVIPAKAWRTIQGTIENHKRVWALGTTVARSLESAAQGKLMPDSQGGFSGETDLFIQPGYDWRIVGGLLTNFHQPRSTLLALVGAFAGLENVKACYAWAVKNQFRLFSYGDLSVWIN